MTFTISTIYNFDVYYFFSEYSNITIKFWNYIPSLISRFVPISIHVGLFTISCYTPFTDYTEHIFNTKCLDLNLSNMSLVFINDNFDLYYDCNSKEDAILLKLEL